MRLRAEQLCLGPWVFYLSVCRGRRAHGLLLRISLQSSCPMVMQVRGSVAPPSSPFPPRPVRAEGAKLSRWQRAAADAALLPRALPAAPGGKHTRRCCGQTPPRAPTVSSTTDRVHAVRAVHSNFHILKQRRSRFPTWTEAFVDFPSDLETRLYLSRVDASAHFFHCGLRDMG